MQVKPLRPLDIQRDGDTLYYKLNMEEMREGELYSCGLTNLVFSKQDKKILVYIPEVFRMRE